VKIFLGKRLGLEARGLPRGLPKASENFFLGKRLGWVARGFLGRVKNFSYVRG
jgi:hypothetical protein